jgi:hypothetical protein
MRTDRSTAINSALVLLFILASATCSAFGATFSIGGKVAGLSTGGSVILLDNGANALTAKANGTFTFTTKLATGAAYDVTVHTQPKGQICTVGNASGKVAKADVTNLTVTCADAFTIGGTVTGLAIKEKLILLDNGGDALTIETLSTSSKGVAFTFKTPIAGGKAYDVTVGTPSTDQVCTVSKGSGKVAKANVTTVAVTCKAGFTIGGTVNGLGTSKKLTLLDNKGNALTLNGNASGKVPFTFTDALANLASYAVTIGTQPVGDTCTLTGGSGKVASKNVTTVAVTCKLNPLTVGGAIAGLKKSGKIILLDNGGNPLTVVGTGSTIKFTFSVGIVSGGSYAVSIGTQPAGQICTVSKGSGKVGTVDVTTVAVTCATGYTIGGSVSGLKTGETLILLNNGGNALTLPGNATGSLKFTFTTELLNGASFKVTVGTQPKGDTCTVTDGSGKVASANFSTVAVSCSSTTITTYTVGGNVSGLSNGATVVLQDNLADNLTVTGTTASSVGFAFKTALAGGASYSVTVLTQPTGETCTVTGDASGKVGSANITDVAVSCATSGGGGGGAAYWIPYALLPFTGVTPAGSNGLFVIPSDKLSTNPTPAWITTDPVKPLGIGVNISSTDGAVTYSPQLMMYADTSTGKDGTTQTTQVFGITLAGTSKVPTPVQIGSFSLVSTTASPELICSAISFETDNTNPETLFAVIETGPSLVGCYEGTGTSFQVVHYQDSPSTAPVTVSIDSTSIFSLYQSGKLTGLLFFDPTSLSLKVYADDTFTSPKQLITGISAASYVGGAANGTDNSTSEVFFQVTKGATSYLYRIDGSTQAVTQIQNLGAGSVAGSVVDDTNLYYIDSTTSIPDTTTTDVIYQVALAGGTPTLLYTAPAISDASGEPQAFYQLVGTNDSVLAFDFESEGNTNETPDPTKASATIYSIPIGKTTTTPTTLASYPASKTSGNMLTEVFLAAPSGSGPSGNVLFATVSNASGSQTAPTIAFSAVSMPLNGGSAATPIANSIYSSLEGIANSGQFFNRVFQVTGITDTKGGWGGGTANVADAGTLADTPLKTVGNVDYVFPAGLVGTLSAISSNNIAVGAFANDPAFEANPAGGLLQSPAAVDLTSNFLWTGAAFTNSLVFPY